MPEPSESARIRLEKLKAYSNLIHSIAVLAKAIGEWFS